MNRIVAVLVAALAVAVVMWNVIRLGDYGLFALIPISLCPFMFVGALLIARVPRNAVGWLLAAAGVCFAIAFVGGEYATTALVFEPGSLPGGEVAAGLSAAAVAPGIGLTTLMLMLFPSGRGLGGRWIWVERFFCAFVVFITLVDLFKDVPVQLGPQSSVIPNPFALQGPLGQLVNAAAQLLDKTSLPMVLVAPVSLFIRYRRSSAVEREQIKWLAYSGLLALLLIVVSSLVSDELSNLIWPVALIVMGTLPVAIALAIFRYRLYDIDLLIRRTLVYGAVSAILLAAYVGGVAVFESLLAPFTAGNGIAVAISTLAVVALFQPVRRRIQSAVDQRFFRAKYDAERTLDAFAARLRDEVDLDTLERELVGVVRETVQPAHASVWLRGTR